MKNKKIRSAFRVFSFFMFLLNMGIVNTYAASDPLEVINNLSTFIFNMLKAIGMIFAGYGVLQIGLSFKTTDPSQKSQGIMAVVGGILVMFAKEIITLITG